MNYKEGLLFNQNIKTSTEELKAPNVPVYPILGVNVSTPI